MTPMMDEAPIQLPDIRDKARQRKIRMQPIDPTHDDISLSSLPVAACQIGATSGLIPNPLVRLTIDELMNKVDEFAQQAHWPVRDLRLLKRGAILARDPHGFRDKYDIPNESRDAYSSLRDLEEDELESLENEVLHRWRQPKALHWVVVLGSISTVVQAWNLTVSGGAGLLFPDALGISIDPKTAGSELNRNSWLVGMISAAPYISSTVLGCWLSDPLNHSFGRRGTIFLAAVFCLLAALGSALSQTWQQLLVCRLLLGVGIGAQVLTASIFTAECSPAQIRGAVVMASHMWFALGAFLGFSANLVVYPAGDVAWRLQLGSAFLPAVPLVIGIYLCPESPRWYIKKHQYGAAYKSLVRLRATRLQAARDLFNISQSELGKEKVGEYRKYWIRVKTLFIIPRVRRAILASSVVMIAQQMCGINTIAFYSSIIFKDAGASDRGALLASWGFGLVGFM
ncbi:MAG: hypothetical protein M1813_000675 [Trichoglossum hirsutum]|nr:MAG: hypothetical protein M1813_000675 [Trichoglossum hirsutum]